MGYQENEEYYLNRFPKRAKTEGMVYYFQKIDGVIVKTEITVEQWKEVGQKYGLERGKSGSGVEHLSTAEYKAKMILEEAESKRRKQKIMQKR